MWFRNSLQALNPWMALSAQAFALGLDAQRVVALRMMRLATGDARSHGEIQRMVTEKMAAAVEAQAAVTAGAMKGSGSHRVAKKVLNVYGKRVRSNRRRLSR